MSCGKTQGIQLNLDQLSAARKTRGEITQNIRIGELDALIPFWISRPEQMVHVCCLVDSDLFTLPCGELGTTNQSWYDRKSTNMEENRTDDEKVFYLLIPENKNKNTLTIF